jgi:hypothetical protein
MKYKLIIVPCDTLVSKEAFALKGRVMLWQGHTTQFVNVIEDMKKAGVTHLVVSHEQYDLWEDEFNRDGGNAEFRCV